MSFNREVWEGRKPLVDSAFGSRTIGSLALVTVGCSVWTDVEKKRSAHDEPLGGIVLDIIHRSFTDGETGEVTHDRMFRTYDPLVLFAHAFDYLGEKDVNQDGVESTDSNRLCWTIRRFAREIASRKGLLTPREGQLIADAHRLTTAVLGGF